MRSSMPSMVNSHDQRLNYDSVRTADAGKTLI